MPPEPPIGVVADATPMLRAGVAGTLRAAGYEIPAEVAAAADVVELVGRHHADVVVVGGLPDLPLVELVRRLHSQPERAKVVLLLGRVPPNAIAELLSLDVEGLLPRGVDATVLVDAVQRVCRGERGRGPGHPGR